MASDPNIPNLPTEEATRSLTGEGEREPRKFRFSWFALLSAALLILLITFFALAPARQKLEPTPMEIHEPHREPPTRRLMYTKLTPQAVRYSSTSG